MTGSEQVPDSGGPPAADHVRNYPVTVTGTDTRFTFGLVLDVANVLTAHGYPPLAGGADHVDLQQALFGFLYRSSRKD
ncbi:hypothetical protein SAMN04489729_4246 [Amycolatopsis lurida]|uniref:Uncharacterized protein n=1 Tax=Amycolatopsis lurida NRRL 2430 TaxID=1460371 RepID=A0A2P2G1S5_AMYLU|nr:hypothetical protein [Amycolatopsis lurida]KFU82924.1 hypothetical protein BB31_00080 [Amycolatopsis lurida NRRL 2430]SED40204.1 hypothetical protein SAMN04489729_4246 [Amycolatopsis lurida]